MTLEQKANEIRKTVLGMLYKAQTSHIGSNFSCIDILTVLYDLKKENDDVLVSKGWVAAAVYALLADKGVIPTSALGRYCTAESKYIGLLEPTVAGVKCAGGSMGYGLPFGVGFALAKRLKGEKGKTYVVMSDGEMQIGTTWESAMIAAHHRLHDLVVIIDANKFQAMGKVKDILSVDKLWEKWKSFGWEVREIDGNDVWQVQRALLNPPLSKKPLVIIANTVKGKGVSFFEDNNEWHYRMIDKKHYDLAKKELG